MRFREHIRPKIYIVLFLLFCAVSVISVSGIFSYFTDNDRKNNEITLGGNNIKIVEDFEPPKEMKPGESFKKVVQINNLGPSDCYTRVKVLFTDSDIGQYCTLDLPDDDTNWIKNESDGYWYYKSILKNKETTLPLFNKVSISSEASSDQMKDVDIIVYAESVQSDGFINYEDAWNKYQANKTN